jgi:hypothetical protein
MTRQQVKVQVGQYQLIDDTTAHCPVRWSHPGKPGQTCTFSIRINTHVGENWASRQTKAVDEARCFAKAFLEATHSEAETVSAK